MSERAEIINGLSNWAQSFDTADEQIRELIQSTYLFNKWFTPDNTIFALERISKDYLDETALSEWMKNLPERSEPVKIGLILAGNIPLVGFHDIIAVLASGNKAEIKLSSKDEIIPKYLLEGLKASSPIFEDRIELVDKLEGFEAVIATGGDNTHRYFESYFGKYPHVFRKNKNGLAILSGNENQKELNALGEDIFRYFGLGCRSVSKLLVPKGYEPSTLFEGLEAYTDIAQHDKYKNNLDYNLTIQIMNQSVHWNSEFLVLIENQSLLSPIACLHIEAYDNEDHLNSILERDASGIQCMVSSMEIEGVIPFGQSQYPGLMDYADGVDTVEWLGELLNIRFQISDIRCLM